MSKWRLERSVRSLFTRMVLGSVIALLSPIVVQGQIVPDETLGEERSQVSPEVIIRDLPSREISGGAERESNLFHSFQQFNIDAEKGAYFTNPVGIESIFSRITGSEPSNILGRLGVLGNADLYLMNPNGILFGPTASLDLQGAFVGTTADGILFGEQGSFSSFPPESPSQLLTVKPSAYLFSQSDIPAIQSFSQGLNNFSGQSLTLLGGDIAFQNSLIQALLGAEFEFGSVAEASSILIDRSLGSPRLVFEEKTLRGNVSFDTTSGIFVNGEGRIVIHAQDVNLSNASTLVSFLILASEIGGVPIPNLGEPVGSNIVIDAVGDVTLSDSSFIGSGVFGSGDLPNPIDSGSIEVRGNSVNVINGSFVGSASLGQGDGGNVVIEAADSIRLSGRSQNGVSSAIGSPTGNVPELLGVGSGGSSTLRASRIVLEDEARISSVSNPGGGNAGGIDVYASDTLSLSGGAFFSTATSGGGDAGSIRVHANNLISLSGVGPNEITGFFSVVNPTENFQGSRRGGSITITTLPSGYFRMLDGARLSGNVEAGAIGEAGFIDIQVGNMTMTNGSQVQSGLRAADEMNDLSGAQGRAGNIKVVINETLYATGRNFDGFQSGFFTVAEAATFGDAGDVQIEATTINFDDAIINSTTQSSGDAGLINIQAQSIQLMDNASITSATAGTGEGSDITINVNRLRVTGGGRITTETSGSGDAGLFTINATEAIELSGTNSDGSTRSNLNTVTNASGSGGDLLLSVPYLSVTDGAGIAVAALGEGKAGSLIIRNAELIEIIGSANAETPSWLDAQAGENSTRRGGSIDVQSNNLRIADGAVITARSFGTSTAGEVILNIADTLHLSSGEITTEALSSSGGNITINSSDGESISGVLILEDNSDITTESLRDGGNITIRIPVVAFDDSDILARSQSANGGNITLSALFSDIIPFDDTAPFDGDGRVDINAAGELSEGNVDITDTGFIQNELAELSDSLVNIDNIVLSSCVVREQQDEGTIAISGGENLQAHPGSTTTTYSTGNVRVVGENPSEGRSGQQDGAIVEPQAVYSLPDGRLVMSRPCL